MQPNDEPVQEQIERFVTDEERDLLSRPGVPDDVRNEILHRLDAFRDSDIEEERGDDVGLNGGSHA